MRKVELLNVNGELYEIIRRFPYTKFKTAISSEDASILREHYGVDKILRHTPTQEYLFVNLIEEAIIVS
jgi:hypothetical protein